MRPQRTERSEVRCRAECDPTPSIAGMYYVYILRNRATQQLYYGDTNH